VSESTITCPKCGGAFEPTAAIAAQVEARVRREAQVGIDAKNREIAALGKSAAEHSAAAAAEFAAAKREREGAAEEVQRLLHAERPKVAEEMQKAARAEAQQSAAAELKALQDDAAGLRIRLAAATQHELDLRKRGRELEDAQVQFELDKQRAIDEAKRGIVEKAQRDAAEGSRLQIAEYKLHNESLKKQVEELNRKVDQGSQQLQGEVFELDLEATLRLAFPRDTIEPVAKGAFGGDALHRVSDPLGAQAGLILWECKRTKTWSDAWLSKLRADQRAAKADLAVLMTTALPKNVHNFHSIDNVWVCSEACAVPLAGALREGLISIAAARRASEGRHTKVEVLYEYVTSPMFRQRVEAIMEAFTSLREDLDAERKAITRMWAKREKQLETVVLNTSSMYGDFQGIVGKSLPAIDALELPPSDSCNDRE